MQKYAPIGVWTVSGVQEENSGKLKRKAGTGNYILDAASWDDVLFPTVLRIHDIWGGSGSGSGDPCLWQMDLDPDPAIFVIDLQDASKKIIFLHNFFCLLLFEATFTSFLKIKSQKESQNSRNRGFSYYFCMMIEGSGSGSRAGSGSIPLTSGSGSGRPKNMWIRWIRIRIRNTGFQVVPAQLRNILRFWKSWEICASGVQFDWRTE